MSRENPYIGLVEMFTTQDDSGCIAFVATVRSTSPLVVTGGGMSLDSDDIMINPAVYAPEIPEAGITPLTAGDKLLVILFGEKQTAYVVCKLEEPR